MFDFHEAHSSSSSWPLQTAVLFPSESIYPLAEPLWRSQAVLLAALVIILFSFWRRGWSDLQLVEHECLCRKGECLDWKGQLQREWRLSLHKELRYQDKGQWVQLQWKRIHLDVRRNFFTARTVNHCNSLPRDVAESPWLEVFKMLLDRVL